MRRLILLSMLGAMVMLAYGGVIRGYYWFDQDSTMRQSVITQGRIQIDASALLDGVHTLHYMVVDDQGRFSATKSSCFAVASHTSIAEGLSCKYVIDGDLVVDVPGTFTTGRIQLTLDVDALPLGLHCIDVLLCGNNGFTTKGATGYFVKRLKGDGGIVNVARWVNDGDAMLPTISLERPTFLISDSWQMPNLAFSPEHFNLVVDSDGTAVAVSCNDLGMALTDAAGRAAITSVPYNEVRQRLAVEPVDDITGGGEFSHAAPTSGYITWWTFRGMVSDSIALRTSRASTLQLFSPDGNELYAAKGVDATKTWGTTLDKCGIYRVAQHSVTGSGDLTLTFFHQHAGDVNGDGRVDIDDVNAIINVMLDLRDRDTLVGGGDVTGDGHTDVDDLNAIINILLAQ